MTEPQTSWALVVLGGITAYLGPIFGPFVLLIFAAAAGSLLALSKAPAMTRLEGAKFIFIGVVLALALTLAAVWLVEKYTNIPGNIALMPLAAAIAAGRDHLLRFMELGAKWLGALLEAATPKGGS